MQQVSFSSIPLAPAYGPNKEYLLVIQPNEQVYDKVTVETKSLFEQYRQTISVKTKPHIAVANFMASEEMEETLIRWIHRVSSQLNSFKVTLNNYSGFPEHTIFLRVQDHQPFKQLAAQLKVIDSYVRLNGYPAVRLITQPHMSIARRLPKDVYDRAVTEYSQKVFCESFIAGELVLLRREHQFDPCKVINIFRLLPADSDFNN